MNNAVNNKRVFCVQPHRPIGFGEVLGKRGDIRLDMLEQKSPDADAIGDSRRRPRLPDELRPRRAGAALPCRRRAAGPDAEPADRLDQRRRLRHRRHEGLHRTRRAGGQPVRRQCRSRRRARHRHDAVPDQAHERFRPRAAHRHAEEPQRLYRPRSLWPHHRHRRPRQCRQARRRARRHFVQDEGLGLRSLSAGRCGARARRREGRARRRCSSAPISSPSTAR